MNRIGISIGIFLLVLLGWLVISSPGVDHSGMPGVSSAPRAPEWSLKDYQGNTVRFADLRGRPLVLNSWAAWCPFCRKELVDFAAVQKEVGDQVVFVAIDRGESLEVAKKYTDELGVTDDLLLLLDPEDAFYKAIGGFSMPETIFVDREGNIRFHKRGPMERAEIKERVGGILPG